MLDIAKRTLSLAIYSMVINRCRLLDRIEHVSAEVENEEHLSETVLDIDQALAELAHLYDAACRSEGGGLGYEKILANAEEDYRRDGKEREQR